jgi:hypothetical protein
MLGAPPPSYEADAVMAAFCTAYTEASAKPGAATAAPAPAPAAPEGSAANLWPALGRPSAAADPALAVEASASVMEASASVMEASASVQLVDDPVQRLLQADRTRHPTDGAELDPVARLMTADTAYRADGAQTSPERRGARPDLTPLLWRAPHAHPTLSQAVQTEEEAAKTPGRRA